MLKKTIGLMLGIIIALNWQFFAVYGAQNPSNAEIEAIIEEVAQNKNIPSVILKAIAWKESNYRQFDQNGNPFISYGNIGIMQINKVHKHLDQNKLKYDIKYNIEAGADILLGRWNMAGKTYPRIGDMNHQTLENWYFSLWGYNGWTSRNNPNISGAKAYQEQIYTLIRTKYNQPITSISWDILPKSGLPSASLHIETPRPFHQLAVSSNKSGNLTVVSRSSRRDSFNEPITREQVAKIVVDAMGLDLITKEVDVKDWQKVSSEAKDYMSTMYYKGLMQGNKGYINPQDFLTREEALLMIYRIVSGNEKSNINLDYLDTKDISPWAIESIKYFVENKVLLMDESQKLRPKDFVTAKELLEWLAKTL